MLDQSLLQSHFIGRDGFRWWLGQIPVIDSWSEQLDGSGWGLRYKVRILGYHPLDDKNLTNDDLPWAQVMLPTTAGSGAANYAQNPKIRPGDMVIGFFMDGDNAQIPVIMGLLGRTSVWSEDEYKNPFTPFTGYTSNIPKPNGRLEPSQTSEHNDKSQPTPALVDSQTAERRNIISASPNIIGREIVFADTCEDTSIKTIKNEVNNLLKSIQDARNKLNDYKEKADKAVGVITSSISWIVGSLFDALYVYLCGDDTDPLKPGLIPQGLNSLYKSIFGATLAASGNPGVAHRTATEGVRQFIPAVKTLEEAIPCVAAKVISGLQSLIKNLLYALIENVKRFVTCAAEQFVGALLNSVIDAIYSGLSAALDGVSSIVSTAFNVTEFLRSNVDLIKSLGGLFDCNQDKSKCSVGTKEWIIGKGPKQSLDVDETFNKILENANNAAAITADVAGQISSFPTNFNQITQSFNIFNGDSNILENAISGLEGCFTGIPTNCGPPIVNIFGGGGSGATAIPIFGAVELIDNVTRSASIIGAIITNGGTGYTFPPFVEIVDECGNGYGAVARALIGDNGQVSSVYMVSAGQGYSVGDQNNSGVTDVYIESPGYGYLVGDTATDNLGNTYSLTIEDGSIISATPINIIKATEMPKIKVNSSTGTGAILKPIFGSLDDLPPKTIKNQVDCVI